MILLTPFALNTSTLAVLNAQFKHLDLGGMFLILSAFSAVYGIVNKNPYRKAFFFVPILFFTWLFGLTALNSVLQGQFADGVIRPWQFIFVDQLPAILTMLFLTVIVFEPIWHKKSYE